jgi:uncharacterized FlaG/YvyC family protein
MAIKINQVGVGYGLRGLGVGEAPSTKRASLRAEAKPVAPVEQSAAEASAEVNGAVAPANSFEALAASEIDPAQVSRAVEQANDVAESLFRAGRRSVEFGIHQDSGRVTITIREEQNGEEVVREIPPRKFLQMAEQLQSLAAEGEKYRGTLVSLDA